MFSDVNWPTLEEARAELDAHIEEVAAQPSFPR
jgi:hypothetical protein